LVLQAHDTSGHTTLVIIRPGSHGEGNATTDDCQESSAIDLFNQNCKGEFTAEKLVKFMNCWFLNS
jgi:hypothetical protein